MGIGRGSGIAQEEEVRGKAPACREEGSSCRMAPREVEVVRPSDGPSPGP